LFSTRFNVMLLALASLPAAAETPLWEPGRVVAVEPVFTPAKEPDPSCRSVPKGQNLPEHCRSSYLSAKHFWRVTVDVGDKRLVVVPYRAPKLLDSLSADGAVYVDPKLAAPSSVEVELVSSKVVRLRPDQGKGILAMVDSRKLLAKSEIPVKAELPAPTRSEETVPAPSPSPRLSSAPPSAPIASGARVVLLEDSDFRDLEVQEFKTQDIGDGAVLYSFTGDSSPIRIASNPPVFLVLANNEAAMGGNPELSRLQVGKGVRQLAYSRAKKHSASSLPITVTQVSATVRKIKAKETLPPGEYVMLLENSSRGFLFDVR
jgi:hypothetical protein